ncbi:hypothetical protein FSP39_020423 [Pinctada imbricata]|uniref:Uncharacterized protein n=1 Tax=Pinctada imbricata TaxID=66713 RepID=A0AA89BSE0_PINIB|nr:hypothetical protein FSP39_020423 [Pinctada imbricata]
MQFRCLTEVRILFVRGKSIVTSRYFAFFSRNWEGSIKDTPLLIFLFYLVFDLQADKVTVIYIVFHIHIFFRDVLQVEVTSPPGLSGSTASIHGDDLYLFAGHGRQGNINDLYHFNLRKREWELLSSYKEEYSNPSPRDKAVSWIYNNKFYCFGGFGPPLQGFLSENGKFTSDDSSYPTRGWNNQLLEYDISKKKWVRHLAPGQHMQAAQVRNKVYIFGGRYQMERLNDLHFVEVDNLQWSGRLTTEGNIPEGRSWHSLSALDDGRLFMYGGFNTSCQPLSDAWTLDLLTLQWSQLKHVPGDRPRLWHTACVTPSQEVVIHGGCSNNILDYQVQTVSFDLMTGGELKLVLLQYFPVYRALESQIYRCSL